MSERTPTVAERLLDELVEPAPQHDRDAGLAIEAHGLVKHFGDIHAVNGIDLRVRPGQVFGFLGQNGSGKTTTVRMLTTLLRPTAGDARVAGFDVLSDDRQVRRAIGVALQEAGLDILQTGRELLRLQSRLYNVPRGEIEDRVRHLLEVVDLTEDADRRIGGYSGGMQRRLDLASALVHSPSIIFLDEPTTGLDPISRQKLWDYIVRLNREDGVTFFLTTQYLEEADQLCDEIAILDAGEIVQQGTPDELKATVSADVIYVQVDGDEQAQQRAVGALLPLPNVEDAQWDFNEGVTVYTKSGHETLPLVVRKLDDEELPFSNLRLARATLDDVFFKATGHRIEPGEQSGQSQPAQPAQPAQPGGAA
jgi:ABC-2 type transport system ATP-binding protein